MMSKVFVAQQVGITPEEAFQVLRSSDILGRNIYCGIRSVEAVHLDAPNCLHSSAWSNKSGLLSFTSTGYFVMGRN
jgi:hypothetical protein